jgi:hypothetical protein
VGEIITSTMLAMSNFIREMESEKLMTMQTDIVVTFVAQGHTLPDLEMFSY